MPLLALLHGLTRAGLAGGLVLAADTATFALLSPYAGTVADHLDRRRLVVACEGLSALLVLLLLLVKSSGTVWVAVLVFAGLAAAKAFTLPAAQAALPNLVPADDLALANVLSGVAWGSMLAVGAALGGLAAATVGVRACFGIDAVSFAVSALLVARCRRPFQQPRSGGEHAGFRADVHEAVRYARSEHKVLALLACKPGVAFANGALVLFPLLADEVFHAGSIGLGLLFAARGLGALAGPLLLGHRSREEPAMWWWLGGCVASCGLLYVGVAVAPLFAVALALVVLAHLGGGANWTISSYGLQRLVPDHVRGRVASADFMLCTMVIAANQALAGVLSGVLPTRLLIGAFGAASLAYAGGWSLATRSLRRPVPSGV